ncbi:glutamate--tRNA ligase [Bacillus thuringiensis]|uniref:glutamate--tRNA ligase n=1 Tax=Bacillus thuringiensis TaxID=1428 RepID=UPI000BFC3DDB|nr:glutamate--tRNA ligase [Bacillus thuringiensis]PGW44147.1 glutamate--tRNA ligase [Bacillus thuringiensis]
MNNELLARLLPEVTEGMDYYIKKFPKRNLDENAMVTRFAPSPTGFLHIGGLFTAFISKKLAMQSNGVFIVRIEDTDKKREVSNGLNNIVSDLSTFGIMPDEGFVDADTQKGEYGPYKQSDRKIIYQSFVKELLETNLAYPCFCTNEQLEEMKEMQESKKVRPGYYGEWAVHRNLSETEINHYLNMNTPYVIRLKSPGREGNKIIINDLIRGNVEFPENDQDIVLLKSDGLPTYHLAHVVDDFLMGITHVIRGDEWLSSTPLHYQLYQVFNLNKPQYCHISPIMKIDGNSKRKLSKRKDPEASLRFYYEEGIPYKALEEYLLTIANSNFEAWREKNADCDLNEFYLEIKNIGTSGSLFDINKITSISKNYISKLSAIQVYKELYEWSREFDTGFEALLKKYPDYSINLLRIEREQVKPRKDLDKWSTVIQNIGYFYDEVFETDCNYEIPEFSVEDMKNVVSGYINVYDAKDTHERWFSKMQELAKLNGYTESVKEFRKNPTLYKGHIGHVSTFIRVAITGKMESPSLYETLQVMGISKIQNRLHRFFNYLEENNQINKYLITPELLDLASRLNCNFVDFNISSKDNVKTLADRYDLSQTDNQNVDLLLSTCLRFEQYSLKGDLKPNGLCFLQGETAMRRLLSVLSGLKSEIIGEREILMQMKTALSTSFSDGKISPKDYKAIIDLVKLAEHIREDFKLNTMENYSTIGGDIFEQTVTNKETRVVMISGGGYMAEEFFRSINDKVEKVIWVNRNLSKLRKNVAKNFPEFKDKIILADLESCKQFLPIVDFLFVAMSHSYNFFSLTDLKLLNTESLIIDVSYPPAVEEVNSHKIMNIANTNFETYVKRQLSKKNIQRANQKIDNIISQLISKEQ